MNPTRTNWFTLLLGELTVVNLGFYAVMAVLAIYLVQELQFSSLEIALALGCYSFGLRFSRLLASPVLHRLHPRHGVLISLALAAAGYASLGYFTTPPAICLSLLAAGTGYGCNGLIVTAMMAQARQSQNRSLGNYAIMYTLSNVAAAIGPLVASILMDAAQYRFIFLFAALAACVSFALTALMLKDLPYTPPSLRWRETLRELCSNTRYLQALVMVFFGWALYTQKYASFPLFVSDALQAKSFVGYYLFAYAAMIIALSIPLSRWFNRRALATPSIISLSYVCYIIGFAALWLKPDMYGAWMSVLLWAAGEAMLIPALNSLTAEIVGESHRVTAFSINAVAIGLGEAGGNIAGVNLYGHFAAGGAPSMVFAVFALLGLCSLIFMKLSTGKGRYAVA